MERRRHLFLSALIVLALGFMIGWLASSAAWRSSQREWRDAMQLAEQCSRIRYFLEAHYALAQEDRGAAEDALVKAELRALGEAERIAMHETEPFFLYDYASLHDDLARASDLCSEFDAGFTICERVNLLRQHIIELGGRQTN